jgi:CDGSH-type Zn-finger protein
VDEEQKSERLVAQRGRYLTELEADKKYFWCYCGRSKSQPFCDNSHVATEFELQMFTVTETKAYFLCGCKRTGTAPFCDTSHDSVDD